MNSLLLRRPDGREARYSVSGQCVHSQEICLEVHLPRLSGEKLADADPGYNGIHVEDVGPRVRMDSARRFSSRISTPSKAARDEKRLHYFLNQRSRTQQSADSPVCLKFPPAAVVVIGPFDHRPEHPGRESGPRSGCHCRRDATVSHRAQTDAHAVSRVPTCASVVRTRRSATFALGIERRRNDDGVNAVLVESGVPKHPSGRSSYWGETLKRFSTKRSMRMAAGVLGRDRVAQLVAAYTVDLAGCEMRLFGPAGRRSDVFIWCP